jgi:hypothetical protein
MHPAHPFAAINKKFRLTGRNQENGFAPPPPLEEARRSFWAWQAMDIRLENPPDDVGVHSDETHELFEAEEEAQCELAEAIVRAYGGCGTDRRPPSIRLEDGRLVRLKADGEGSWVTLDDGGRCTQRWVVIEGESTTPDPSMEPVAQ